MPSSNSEKSDGLVPRTEEVASSVNTINEAQWNSVFVRKLKTWEVESRGIDPVPVEDRTDAQLSKSFFVWFSASLSILPFSLGTIGPLAKELTFRESAGVIVGFTLLASVLPAYFSTFGPKLGLRQMVQARYSFGWYAAVIPAVFQFIAINMSNILNIILGGQILSVVSGGTLGLSIGIIVISSVSLVISFFGYRVLNWYQRYAWFPVLIVYLVVLGLGGKYLSKPVTNTSTSHRGVLSYASSVIGYTLPASTSMSDYTNYMQPRRSSCRLFMFTYLAIVLPNIGVVLIGAAFASSLPKVPEWQLGYNTYGDSGIIAAVLAPVGGFGKFLLVLLALSIVAGVATGLYSLSFGFQVVVPAARRVPRYMLSLLGVVIMIPSAIMGAGKFQAVLQNCLGLTGYASAAFVAIIATEHLVFRRGDFNAYDISAWNSPKRLPPGLAAVGTCILACIVMVLCVDQTWYVGPIAKLSGDIGVEVGLVSAVLCYLPLRFVEKNVCGR